MSLPLPLLYLSKSTVPENSPHGWVVGHFELADNRYSVNLIDDAGGQFALDANNNQVAFYRTHAWCDPLNEDGQPHSF